MLNAQVQSLQHDVTNLNVVISEQQSEIQQWQDAPITFSPYAEMLLGVFGTYQTFEKTTRTSRCLCIEPVWGDDTAAIVFHVEESVSQPTWSIPIGGAIDPTYRAVVETTINGKSKNCYYELWWPGSLGNTQWHPTYPTAYSVTLYNRNKLHVFVRFSNDTQGYATWIWIHAKVSDHTFYITQS